MSDIFNNNFMPHGHCYFWQPEIVWTHAISDSIIALAYFAIPLTLIHIVRRRRDFGYIWMGILFAIFILGCGTTHIFDVINIWHPWYVTDSAVRAVTALASIGTAIMLVKITPHILVIPSAKQWKEINAELLTNQEKLIKSNEDLTRTEQILKELNSDLESRVLTRTEDFEKKAREFEFLSDSIPQLVWTTDANGKIDYLNRKWTEYTGLSTESAREVDWASLIHPSQKDQVFDIWRKSLATGEEYTLEISMRGKDDEYKWFLAKALPMKDAEGKITKWFGTCTDIQEQKTQSKELEAKNIDLRRINNDLDNFIYTASHDLKAPITNMEGLLHTIMEEVNEECLPGKDNLFGLLENSVVRLKTTINDLTDVSRVQKSIKDDYAALNIQEILAEYEDNHKEQLQISKAVIDTNFAEKEIFFSKRNFRSIFYNVLNNALKYQHPERTPFIRINTYKELEYVVLEVADNGIGFDIKQKEKVFGMFKRLHTHVAGSGVGLYIVQRIIENGNGKIEVDSAVGKGTTFKIFFPLTD